jgi:FkbM family methyltransferase
MRNGLHRRPRVAAVLLRVLVVLAIGSAAWAGFAQGHLQGRVEMRPYLSDAAEELETLGAKYPGPFNSERAEEWILRDFFQEKRHGVFVDVGANHYQRFSNTYYLETALSWSGVAIEPQVTFAADYTRYRPRTTFVPLFVSDQSNQTAKLYVPSNDLVASSDRAYVEQQAGAGGVTIEARTTTLDDVLARLGLERIDFLTMDIELSEPAALRGFTISHYRPALVCIEGHPQVRQQILDYFAHRNYVLLGRYLRADSRNLWFVPLE